MSCSALEMLDELVSEKPKVSRGGRAHVRTGEKPGPKKGSKRAGLKGTAQPVPEEDRCVVRSLVLPYTPAVSYRQLQVEYENLLSIAAENRTPEEYARIEELRAEIHEAAPVQRVRDSLSGEYRERMQILGKIKDEEGMVVQTSAQFADLYRARMNDRLHSYTEGSYPVQREVLSLLVSPSPDTATLLSGLRSLLFATGTREPTEYDCHANVEQTANGEDRLSFYSIGLDPLIVPPPKQATGKHLHRPRTRRERKTWSYFDTFDPSPLSVSLSDKLPRTGEETTPPRTDTPTLPCYPDSRFDAKRAAWRILGGKLLPIDQEAKRWILHCFKTRRPCIRSKKTGELVPMSKAQAKRRLRSGIPASRFLRSLIVREYLRIVRKTMKQRTAKDNARLVQLVVRKLDS